MSTSDRQPFFFESMPVGYFVGPTDPGGSGRYHYMPFRGPGHLRMHQRLKTGAKTRCDYRFGDVPIRFTVLGCPEYGVLELGEFEVLEGDGVRANERDG